MPTPAFREATERLYDVFSRYPRPRRVEGCPCCVSEDDRARLHAASLRALSAGDLRRYASKALTTWGTEDDFRHYLPRLLELVWEIPVDPEILLGKLSYGGWLRWPPDEQDALSTWLDAWWLDTLRSTLAWRAPTALRAITCAGRDVEELLATLHDEAGVHAAARAAALALVELLAHKRTPVWLSERASDTITCWLAARVALIEQAVDEASPEDRELRADLDALLLRAQALPTPGRP